MKKEIEGYITRSEEILNSKDIERLRKFFPELNAAIGFYQHERLVHLIVTLFFGLFFVISVGFIFMANRVFLILALLFLALLVPYIAHYYFLENSVQKLYTYYYRCLDMLYGDNEKNSPEAVDKNTTTIL